MQRWTGKVGVVSAGLSKIGQNGVEWDRGIESATDSVARWSWTRWSAGPDKSNGGGACPALSWSQCRAFVLDPGAEAIS